MMRGTRSPWVATPFVAVTTLLGLQGLTGMVVWGGALTTAIVLMAIVTLAIAITRMVTRSRALPTAVGAVVAILASVPAFARGPEDQHRLLPTPTALRELAAAVGDGVREAATTAAPADVTRPLLAVLMAGLVVVFLVAEHLAVSWRAAAVSGLVLLAPWMPAIALQHRVSVRLLLAAIGCWVITLALTKRPTGATSRPRPLSTIVATGATLGLVALVVPSALGANGWGLLPRLATPDQLDGTTRLNLALDLRNSLTVNSSSSVLIYVSTGERPDAFRQYTLSEFDGTGWTDADDRGDTQPLDGVLWPQPVESWDERPKDRVEVEVLGATERSLAIPPVPREVDISGDWAYSPLLDEVSSTSETTIGLRYAFEADMRYFTAEYLRGLGNATGDDATVGETYFALPEGVDVDRFTTLATEITAGATTRYDKALALQEYFRDPSQFRYDTTVEPDGDDSVSVFLDDREGFCVHFATAMSMLARSIGLPSRIAVGYLPGSPADDGAYVVTGGDAHTWPEIYFAGAGWVRFEPTPTAQTGARPSYATPEGAETPSGEPVAPVPTAVPTGAPGEPLPGTTTEPKPEPEVVQDTVAWPLLVVIAVVVVIALAVASWWTRRRRELLEAESTPETVWAGLRARLPAGVAWNSTHTPAEAAEHVEGALSRDDHPLDPEASIALATLAGVVSDYRYAPDGHTVLTAQAESLAAEVAQGVARATEDEPRSRLIRVGARGGSRPGA